MSFIVPVGPDRADGVTKLPPSPQGAAGTPAPLGTPTPAGVVFSQSSAGPGTITIEERPDGTDIERAEQATFQKKLVMGYQAAVSLLGSMGRGTFLADSGSGFGVQTVWRILSSRIRSLKGNLAELSYTAESISFDSPPDDFNIVPVELGLDILKHPRYAIPLSPVVGDSGTYTTVGDTDITFVQVKTSIIRLIQAYRDAPFFPSANNINGLIQNNILDQLTTDSNNKTHIDVQVPNVGFDPSQPPTPANADGSFNPPHWDGKLSDIPEGNSPYWIVTAPVDLSSPSDPIAIAMAAAKELISKLWRGEDTPLSVGWEIEWDQYVFKPVYLDGGGYIQDPFGIVPDYFMDPNQNGSSNIFKNLSSLNPQMFSADGTIGGPLNISWLRMPDSMEYQRTWFKIKRRWRGTTLGGWDFDLYNQEPRPTLATQYEQLI